MVTGVGSVETCESYERRPTALTERVSPIERVRAEIDQLFAATERPLSEILEDVGRLLVRRKVMGQLPPCAARPRHVQDRVDNAPTVMGRRAPTWARPYQRGNQIPLRIGQIRWARLQLGSTHQQPHWTQPSHHPGSHTDPLTRQHQEAIWALHQAISRLRAVLMEFYPQALHAFPNLKHKGAKIVLAAVPTQAAAAKLTRTKLATLLQRAGRGSPHRYLLASNRTRLSQFDARVT